LAHSKEGRVDVRFCFATCQVLILTKSERRVRQLRRQGDGVGASLLRLKAIGVEAVEITADGDDLWDGGELAPATRVAHFPAEPVDAGGQSQAGYVVGGSGEADKGLSERIGLVPPWRRSHRESLMHVEDSGGVDAGAEEDEFFLDVSRQDNMCWPDRAWHGGTHKWRGIGVCGFRLAEQ
jgi:hypothetical protein